MEGAPRHVHHCVSSFCHETLKGVSSNLHRIHRLQYGVRQGDVLLLQIETHGDWQELELGNGFRELLIKRLLVATNTLICECNKREEPKKRSRSWEEARCTRRTKKEECRM
jgi:hypothetical protein